MQGGTHHPALLARVGRGWRVPSGPQGPPVLGSVLGRVPGPGLCGWATAGWTHAALRCAHTCANTHTCVRAHTCAHRCVCLQTCIHAFTLAHRHPSTQRPAHAYVHACAVLHTHSPPRVCTHVAVHACVHTLAQTCTHTRMWMCTHSHTLPFWCRTPHPLGFAHTNPHIHLQPPCKSQRCPRVWPRSHPARPPCPKMPQRSSAGSGGSHRRGLWTGFHRLGIPQLPPGSCPLPSPPGLCLSVCRSARPEDCGVAAPCPL